MAIAKYTWIEYQQIEVHATPLFLTRAPSLLDMRTRLESAMMSAPAP